MAISSAAAKQLLTQAEMSLFTESLSRNVKSLDEKALRARVSRARRMRDKYQQLAHRQDREARGKQPPRGRGPSQGSSATRKKTQIFAESLARFERQLAFVQLQAESAAQKPSPSKRSVKKLPAAKRSASAKKAATTKAATTKAATKKAATKKTATKKTATKKTATKKAATKKAATKKATRATKKASGSQRKRTASRSAATTLVTSDMPKASGRKKATARAKKARLEMSDAGRKQRHRVAQTRRAQARRDAR